MDHERKELLAQKKAQLKKRQKRAEIQQYKDRLTKSIEHFSQKYRYADEAIEAYNKISALLERLGRKNVISQHKASNLRSKLMLYINKL